MNDKELISKMRELADRVFHGDSKPSDFRIIDRATDALEARQSSGDTCEDDRETLDKVLTEYDMALYTKEETLDRLASRAAVPDAATKDMTVAEFCEALGFVDDSTTPAKLRDIVEPIQWWDSEARDHVECARICEQCGETLARTLCGECHGGGQLDGGNGTVSECGNCGGAGWLHEGCAEVAYADLVAERDDLEERLAGYLCDSTGGLLSKTGYDVRTMVAHTEEYYDKVHAEARKEVEAERDAALAAIERVRAIHERDMVLRDYCSECSDFGSDQFPPGQMVEWPCPTIAALDGAPEPEWEYGCAWDDGATQMAFPVEAAAAHLRKYPEPNGRLVRRRPGGPWLPVEGENDEA